MKNLLVFRLLAAALVAVGVANVLVLNSLSGAVTSAAGAAAETEELPQVELTAILDASCADCASLGAAESAIRAVANATVKKVLDFSSPEAQGLISAYGVKRIPTITVTGETDNPALKTVLTQLGGLRADGTFVYATPPVYYDLDAKAYVGRVSLTLISPDACEQCANLTEFVSRLKQSITITSENSVNASQASALLFAYNIKTLPAVILSKDAAVYSGFSQAWTGIGSVEPDGVFVLRASLAPYWQTENATVRGLVELVQLTAESCADCYNVSLHEDVLKSYGAFVANKSVYDAASPEGKQLIQKYNITSVPTVLLSPEAGVYTTFMNVWQNVGTVEPDGWLVFRAPEVFGKHVNTTV